MNLDYLFLNALLASDVKEIARIKSGGFKPEWLHSDQATEAINFVLDYTDKYQKVPSAELVSFKTASPTATPTESLDFAFHELQSRYLTKLIHDGLTPVVDSLKARQPHQVKDLLEVLLKQIRKEDVSSALVMPLMREGYELIDEYQRIKNGERGLQTRWPTINEWTGGFWPEDLISIVARLGTGKTWAAIIIAHDAWAGEYKYFKDNRVVSVQRQEDRKRVLFITTEVSTKRVRSRFVALHAGLPYGLLRSGRLSPEQERSMIEIIQQLLDEDRFQIVNAAFDFTLSSIEGAIEAAEPDLVVIDGAYLIRSSGNTRQERMASLADDYKRLAQKYKLPLVLTAQLNRTANPKERSSIDASAIALSDALGWNSDLALAMIQDDNAKQQRRMFWKPLKVRDGFGDELEGSWDFSNMDFEELVGGNIQNATVGSDAYDEEVPF